MVTSLDILDTAVKIGLGAAITGVSAWALASKQHRIDLAKERIRRRQQLLETVAEDVAAFTHIPIPMVTEPILDLPQPNKRLKLTGGDRPKGIGVLCPLGGTDFVPHPCAGLRVARSLSAIR